MPSSFSPQKDIPDLAGRVILITGGTAGLGAGSVRELARHGPSHILFSGRNQSKADVLIKEVNQEAPKVKLTFIKCDISSFESVRAAAESVKLATDVCHTVMLNAGIMALPPARSADGYEIQFATNHLGHALLVDLLLPLLQHTAELPKADVRVINLTSIAYDQAPSSGIDFATLQTDQANMATLGTIGKWRRYGQSKLAQLLYTQELARHRPEITFVSIHPGVILTDLFANVDFMTKLPVLILSLGAKTPVGEGHYNQCWAATCEKKLLKNGEYYVPIGELGKRVTNHAKDDVLAGKLWDWTQKVIGNSV